ncbi:MAG: right-handed parallel beta-helix repeat-containing protein [Planctomycetota bacterium]
MWRASTWKIGWLVGISLASAAHGATLYVKPNGTGNCGTWASACSLPTALNNAVSDDSLWVQSGTYQPFALKNGVKIIGGFAGTETAASQSNPTTNQTIVDAGLADRCVSGSGEGPTTMLRGFILRNGYADGMDVWGGGILLESSSAMIVQCVFENNRASHFGAGAAVKGAGSPEFINCTFHNNGTGSGTTATPYGGGGVYVESGTPKFTNCLFVDNVAGEAGGLLVRFGGVTLVNCTIANNRAEFGSGGGVFDQEGAFTIQNSILWGNTSVRTGAQIYNQAAKTSAVSHSDVQGGYPGTSNLDADPQFIDPGKGDYDIPGTSPCKDVGNNASLPADVADLDWDTNVTEPIPKDLGGVNRKIQFTVDLGAYEGPLNSQ